MRSVAPRIKLLVSKPLLILLVMPVVIFGVGGKLLGNQAAAATNSTINFQARLMAAGGSIAPDGDYNIEFKVYNALSSTGTPNQGACTMTPGTTADPACLWTETRTGTDKVHVANGYVTVNLGSVTSFPTTINWDQQLWLTMNIGGTGSPSWDGEMSPRLKLTGVPYAFRAGQLASLAGSNTGVLKFAASFGQDTVITLPDPGASTATVCYQTSASCGFLTGTAGSYIQNGTTQQTANFNILGTGTGNSTAIIQGAASGTVPVAIIRGGSTPGGGEDILSIQNAAGTSTFVKVDNTGKTTTTKGVYINDPSDASAFTVQGSASMLFTVDTSGGKVWVGDPNDCSGRFCVTNSISTGGSSYTNSYNSTLAVVGSASTFIGQDIVISDTSVTSVANTIKGLRIDASGTTDTTNDKLFNALQVKLPLTSTNGYFISFDKTDGVTTNNMFKITATGVVQLGGGLTSDITTPNTTTSNSVTIKPGTSSAATTTGAALSLKGGDVSGTTTVTAGAVTIQGGAATGASGTRTAGGVTVDSGSSTAGFTSNGAVTIGGTNAKTITLGFTAASSGNTQTINIGNLNAGGTENITIGSGTSATGGTTTLQAKGALTLTGGAASVWDVTGGLSLQTASNAAITTGTGLFTQGGDVTFSGTTLRTITGPTTGGLTINDTGGPLTLSTTTSGTLAVTSAGALNFTGAAPSTWSVGAGNTLSLVSSNINVTTGGVLTTTSAALTGANALTLGTTGTNTGAILFKGSTAASATLTLIGPANPSTNTITLPNETGTVCTTGSVCTGYAAAPVTGAGNYLVQAPTSNTAGLAGANYIQPATTGVNGLTVNGTTTGTAATALVVNQAGASNGIDVTTSNAGTNPAGITIARTAAGTTTSGLSITDGTAGTIGSGISIAQSAGGTITTGIDFGGTMTTGINFGGSNTTDINRTSGVLSLQGTGGITLTAGGTTAVSLDSAGAGSVLLGNANATTLGIGSNAPAAARTTTINGGNAGFVDTINIGTGNGTVAGAKTIHIGDGAPSGSGTNLITIGSNSNVANTTTIQGGNGASAIALTPQITGGITIGATAGTGNITLGSSSATQSVLIGNGTGISNVNIANATTAGSTVNIAGAATATGVTDIVNIATGNTAGTGGKTVHIADGAPAGTGVNSVTIGSNAATANITTIQGGNGSGAIVLQVSSGGAINVGNTAAAKTINIGSTAALAGDSTINIGTTSANNLQAIAIGANAAGGATAASNTLTLEGGSTATGIQIGNSAQAHGIKIGTDGTTTQTIVVGSTSASSVTTLQGGTTSTGNGAINVSAASAGLINIGNTNANTISIGAVANDVASTVNINSKTGGSATKNTTIGSTDGSSTTTIQGGTSNIIFNTGGTVRAVFDTANDLFLGNGASAASPTATFTVQGTASTSGTIATSLSFQGGAGLATSTGSAGGTVTLQGGAGGGSNANNGGNVTLQGGAGSATGVKGVLLLSSGTVYTTTSLALPVVGSAAQIDVDTSSAILASAATGGQTFTVPSPTITTAGRVLYVTNSGATNAFTLVVGATSFLLNPASTATLIWNGTAWTGAGADASTLQNVYNNSPTPAIITTTSSTKVLTLQAGSTFDAVNLFSVLSSGGNRDLIVDTSNHRVGVALGSAEAPSFDLTLGTTATTRTIGITAQSSSNTVGGSLTVQAAAGNGTGGGGTLTLQAGTNGGSAGAAGGPVNITATAGASTGTGASGGNVTITGGAGGGSGASNGGSIILVPGAASGTGAKGAVQIGLSAGTGALLNNGTTTNTVTTQTITTGTTALSNQDLYSAFVVTASNPSLTLSLANPVPTTAGRTIYISNASASSNLFTLAPASGASISLNTGATATLLWNGSAWTYAGADASSILNQTTAVQAAGFNIQPATNVTAATITGAASSTAATFVLKQGTSQTGSMAQVLDNSTNAYSLFTIGSTGGFSSMVNADSATAFQFQNAAGATQLSLDTTNTASSLNLAATNGGGETSGTFTTQWPAAGLGTGVTVSRDVTTNEFASGVAGVKVISTTGGSSGADYVLPGGALTVSSTYIVSFSAKLAAGGTPSTFTDLDVRYNRTGTTQDALCTTGSAQTSGTSTLSTRTLSTTGWTKVTCSFVTSVTSGTGTANLAIIQTAAATTRTWYIDNLSIVAQNSSGTQNVGDLHVGGAISQGLTLLTLDTYAATPFSGANASLAGSMYFDTTQGKIQCYDGTTWGACGAAPNTIVTLTPEYAGAVLNGTGIGTMTSDFCANSAALTVGTLCASNDARNFYKWTSPQGSGQAYNIYVTYKLPVTFKSFVAGSTSMVGLVDNTTNAYVKYAIFKSTGSAITQCSALSTVVGSGVGSANTWTSGVAGTLSGTTDPSACSYAAGNNVIFQIQVSAASNAASYAENLNFQFSNQ